MSGPKKENKNISVLIGVIIAILLAMLTGDNTVGKAVVAVIVVFVAVILAIGSTVKKRGAEELPAMMSALNRRKTQAHKEFPVPDAHCVVCDTTGVDHFERDRQLRLQQLDEWLKNGIIDRSEYRVLKDRYSKS